MATPMTLVRFGATGDLARSKLWPALHDLAASGRLPEELDVLGATEAVNGAGADPELYERLEQALEARKGDRLTYLSVAPSLFGEIAGRLAGIGLGREAGAASRVVIEKPFGEDLAGARELRAALHEHFDEEQLPRIDHSLGKEVAQNLLVLRFVNGTFEPLWDRRSIESIQITVAEDGGVDGRGDFHDATGALRDFAQTHLLQLLALSLMDAPARVAGEEPRAERLKVLRPIRAIEPGDAVLGQYEGYGDEAAERGAPEAYERLLGDAPAGDTTLFTSSEEVEAQRAAVEPLLPARPEPVAYPPGWAGPELADDNPGRDGRRWRPR